MVSKTKYPVTEPQIRAMFRKAGFENVTNIQALGDGEFNAVFSVSADGQEYALKIAPAPGCDVLTYEKNMMTAELYWYDVLKTRTAVCAPTVICRDASAEIIDADWFIMEKVSGMPLSRCKLQSAEKAESRQAMAEMLAQMHSIRGMRFGYHQGEAFDRWDQALEKMIVNLMLDCAAKGRRCPRGQRMLTALKKHRDVFARVDCRMVNYDLHPGNVLYDPGNPKGKYWLVDLERGFWGDRVFDFVNLEMGGLSEEKSALLRNYNRLTEEKIQVDADVKIRYAMAQALLGLIMDTEKYYRYTPRHFGWWRNVLASAYLFDSGIRELEK